MTNKTLNKIERERQQFKKYLLKNGLKLTNGRNVVFNLAMNAHGHFSAEELAKDCRKNKPTVSRATVYRCIRDLLEACVIRETAFGEKHHHYEHIYDEKPHHHARCIRCGNMIEFPDLKEDIIYHPILEKEGFTVLGHEMHFYGICKKCKK